MTVHDVTATYQIDYNIKAEDEFSNFVDKPKKDAKSFWHRAFGYAH